MSEMLIPEQFSCSHFMLGTQLKKGKIVSKHPEAPEGTKLGKHDVTKQHSIENLVPLSKI